MPLVPFNTGVRTIAYCWSNCSKGESLSITVTISEDCAACRELAVNFHP